MRVFGVRHSGGLTQDALPKPAAVDSTEQQTAPLEQSSGPSQVIVGDWHRAEHLGTTSIKFVVGQQGPVALVQDEPSQSTVAPAAIVGSVQDGSVADQIPGAIMTHVRMCL